MTPKTRGCALGAAALLSLTLFGCTRSTDGLQPFPLDTNPVVFTDVTDFGGVLDWRPFLGSKFDALAFDTDEFVVGESSMRFTVPAPGDPSGSYAGGVIAAMIPRNLSSYNAITFYAKASQAITLNEFGIGNDNSGFSRFTASTGGIPLTTDWQQFTVPVPITGKLTAEAGMFFFAEGAEGASAYDIWFDDIRYANVTTITNPRPSLTSQLIGAFVGTELQISGTKTIFNVRRYGHAGGPLAELLHVHVQHAGRGRHGRRDPEGGGRRKCDGHGDARTAAGRRDHRRQRHRASCRAGAAADAPAVAGHFALQQRLHQPCRGHVVGPCGIRPTSPI